MKRCIVLWDLESIPFFYNCLVKKHILDMGFNYYLDPRIIALSKKNLRLSRIKKKRGFEMIITEDLNKDGADNVLYGKSKKHRDRTAILVSNDLRLAKKIAKKQELILFYINKDIPVHTVACDSIHIYDNFQWDLSN